MMSKDYSNIAEKINEKENNKIIIFNTNLID